MILGIVAECHFDCNFHISVKIVSKFFGLPQGKQKNLFASFDSKFRKFRFKSTFGNNPFMYPASIQQLINLLHRFPGVGPRTAERYVFHLLQYHDQDLIELATSIARLKNDLHQCKNCYNFANHELCIICSNPQRDTTILCLVADARDLVAIERTGHYQGVYFILGGTLDPLHGITPDKLHIQELLSRLNNPHLRPSEIILGLNPNIEGETTTLYLKQILKNFPIRMTRLARGLPTGSDLEYADADTVSAALAGRREVNGNY